MPFVFRAYHLFCAFCSTSKYFAVIMDSYYVHLIIHLCIYTLYTHTVWRSTQQTNITAATEVKTRHFSKLISCKLKWLLLSTHYTIQPYTVNACYRMAPPTKQSPITDKLRQLFTFHQFILIVDSPYPSVMHCRASTNEKLRFDSVSFSLFETEKVRNHHKNIKIRIRLSQCYTISCLIYMHTERHTTILVSIDMIAQHLAACIEK